MMRSWEVLVPGMGAEVIEDDGEFTSIDPYDPTEWERRRVPPEVTVEVDGRYL